MKKLLVFVMVFAMVFAAFACTVPARKQGRLRRRKQQKLPRLKAVPQQKKTATASIRDGKLYDCRCAQRQYQSMVCTYGGRRSKVSG